MGIMLMIAGISGICAVVSYDKCDALTREGGNETWKAELTTCLLAVIMLVVIR